MVLDMEELQTWVGRTVILHDEVTAAPLRGLGAMLDCNEVPSAAGDRLAPCWHWLYFLPTPRQSELGPDGHARRGGFLPPVPLPRRMWAGSQLQFLAPLRLGQKLERISRIADVRVKEGRSGPLVFVHVDHVVCANGVRAVSERHDIVYRDLPALGKATGKAASSATEAATPKRPVAAQPASPPLPQPQWARRIVPDDVLLFRYSALTFNGHRIHYDRRYVTEVEGYPGLVVHGPLIATLLLDLLRRERPTAQVGSFSFRAVQPLFDTAPFTVCGRMQDEHTAHLWACTATGQLAMDAHATLMH